MKNLEIINILISPKNVLTCRKCIIKTTNINSLLNTLRSYDTFCIKKYQEIDTSQNLFLISLSRPFHLSTIKKIINDNPTLYKKFERKHEEIKTDLNESLKKEIHKNRQTKHKMLDISECFRNIWETYKDDIINVLGDISFQDFCYYLSNISKINSTEATLKIIEEKLKSKNYEALELDNQINSLKTIMNEKTTYINSLISITQNLENKIKRKPKPKPKKEIIQNKIEKLLNSSICEHETAILTKLQNQLETYTLVELNHLDLNLKLLQSIRSSLKFQILTNENAINIMNKKINN